MEYCHVAMVTHTHAETQHIAEEKKNISDELSTEKGIVVPQIIHKYV